MATASYASALSVIRSKMDAEVAKRDALRTEVDALTAKIDAKVKFAPKKPLFNAAGYDAKILELENKHRSSALSMKEEKELIRNIEDLRRSRNNLGEYAIYQESLDKLYQERKVLQTDLNAINNSVRELRGGVRKLEVIIRVIESNPGKPVDISKITSEDVPITEDIRPRLIGKKGAGLRTIEDHCGVNLDIEETREPKSSNTGGGKPNVSSVYVRITGLPNGINAAKQKIAEVAAQEEVTFTISPPTVAYLLGRGGTAIHDLEERFGVNVRLAKEEGKVHVRGHTDAVNGFKAVIAEGERSKTTFSVDSRVLAAVIGKGGANLKKIYEDTHVQVDIGRPAGNNTENTGPANISLVYIGENAAETIQRAKQQVLDLVNDNTEVDEVIPIPRDAVSWLLGNNGDRIKAFSKDNGVYARAVRKDESPNYNYHGGDAAVVMRGTREALTRAQAAFPSLMQDFAKSYVTITITSSQARVLIGPSGAGVRKLRTDTGAQIEIDEATGVRPAPVTTTTTTTTKDKKSADKKPAADAKKEESNEKRARANRADEVGLPVGSALVTIRGDGPVVIAAQNTIRGIIASLREIRLPISGGLINTLMKNKGEVVHGIESETGSLINVTRDVDAGNAALAAVSHPPAKGGKLSAVAHVRPASLSQGANPAGVVVIAGTDAQVTAAEAKIIALASAKAESSFPIPDTSAVGEVVGKGGANLKVIQDETNTEIDIDKDAGIVRITGAAAALASAEAKLRAAFDKISRENTTLNIDKSLFASLIGKGGANIKVLQDETGAQIHADSNKGEIRIHGTEEAVAAARARVLAACKLDEGSIGDVIVVDPAIVGRLIGKGGGNLRKLEESNNVSIGCDTNGGKITLRGTASNVSAAKAALRRQIREASRIEDTVVVPQEYLGGIIGTKGLRLRALENACHVSIDLPRDRTGKQTTVSIRGSAVGLQKGKAVLTKLAAGHTIRALPRSEAMVHGFHGHNLHGEAGVTITSFGAEPVDPADVADGVVSVSPLENALILVDGVDAAAVTRAVAFVDRTLASRYGAGYQMVKVPTGIDEDSSNTDDSSSTTSSFASIKTENKVGLQVENEGGYVAVWGDNAHVKAAVERINTLANAFSLRHAEVSVEQWMLGGLVGSKGANIQSLEKETGLKINVERNGPGGKPVLLLAAPSAAVLAEGRTKITGIVSDLASRRVVLAVPSEAFGSIIGKGGAVIRSIQEETKTNIDTNRDIGSISIRGPSEAAVTEARNRIEAVVSEAGFDVKESTDEEIASLNKAFTKLHYDDVDAVIGIRGATIRTLETDFSVSINASRDNGTVAIRGTNPDNVVRAYAAVEKIIQKSHADRKEAHKKEVAKVKEPVVEAVAVPKSTGGPHIPIGGSASDVVLSKNARRRANRKGKKDDDTASVASEHVPAPAPAPVVVAKHAPAPAPVHAPHVPAVTHVQPPVVHHVPTTTTHSHQPASHSRSNASNNGAPTADEILAQILGNSYQTKLQPAPVVTAPAPAPVQPPVSRPPPGFSSSTATKSTTTTAKSTAPATTTTTSNSSNAPVWGTPSKSASNAASNAPTADDILAQLNFPGLVLSAPAPAPAPVTTKPATKTTAPASNAANNTKPTASNNNARPWGGKK